MHRSVERSGSKGCNGRPLFTRVRGRVILRSPFAGSCIDRPPGGVRMASKALHAVRRRSSTSCGVGWTCRETNARALSLTPWPLSQDVCTRRRIFGDKSRFAPSRSPKSVGKDRSVLRVLWPLQTFVCVRGVSAIVHIYTSVLQALAGRGRMRRLEGGFQRYRGGAMQDLGYELPRIPFPRTWVNSFLAGRPLALREARQPLLALAVYLCKAPAGVDPLALMVGRHRPHSRIRRRLPPGLQSSGGPLHGGEPCPPLASTGG